ncbi:hypothetical protein SAMN03159475_4457 [Pseudomonas sp. NFPP33]|nr:hypothetical protein [Pseudomonas sp. NFPP33]SDA80851.1 hypothetical protein SAMN03159475_4457 [Pseudomonas sp. NFPP33]
MASKTNTARQHKHFAVLIDADNAPVAIFESLIKFNETVDKLRVVHPTDARATCYQTYLVFCTVAEKPNIQSELTPSLIGENKTQPAPKAQHKNRRYNLFRP